MTWQPTIQSCTVCGSSRLKQSPCLWPGLIAEWQLSPQEVEYINRQQGFHCLKCHAQLRTMALASGIMQTYRFDGLFCDFVRTTTAKSLRVLEINEAGLLHPYLAKLPNLRFVSYPQTDIMNMAELADHSYDLVVHSETLEHVENPVRGLAECRRVLVPDGVCAFTVPMIVGRMTRSRAGLAPSHHGGENDRDPGNFVHTEFGADVWCYVLQAGFKECGIVCLEYPAAMVMIAVA
ncbi:MAG: class I SAM-dependent methyltransferase [Phycisphaeraceae bacterium]|nr:class I SAM-dependent methyltransferase [Phycisphaeraceae bacterium]